VPKYQPRDRFYRMARERGLKSRAAFKLDEILARFDLLPRGGRAVDLGCAPGGWLQILARAAGPGGRVAGVDLDPVRNPPAGVIAIAGDIRDPAVAARVAAALGGPADLVTSDLAPKLSGVAARDQARQQELIAAALDFARLALRPGGAMVAKLFMDARFRDAVAAFEREFESVETVRTRASRPGSSELYVVARRFRRRGA
jgi:23S rRNA (uridine2552-2'-O)-methyltransferase